MTVEGCVIMLFFMIVALAMLKWGLDWRRRALDAERLLGTRIKQIVTGRGGEVEGAGPTNENAEKRRPDLPSHSQR
jgi:hypothetical protein